MDYCQCLPPCKASIIIHPRAQYGLGTRMGWATVQVELEGQGYFKWWTFMCTKWREYSPILYTAKKAMYLPSWGSPLSIALSRAKSAFLISISKGTCSLACTSWSSNYVHAYVHGHVQLSNNIHSAHYQASKLIPSLLLGRSSNLCKWNNHIRTLQFLNNHGCHFFFLDSVILYLVAGKVLSTVYKKQLFRWHTCIYMYTHTINSTCGDKHQ